MRLATYTASDVRKTLFDASGVSEDAFSEDGKAMVDAIISWAATPEGDLRSAAMPGTAREVFNAWDDAFIGQELRAWPTGIVCVGPHGTSGVGSREDRAGVSLRVLLDTRNTVSEEVLARELLSSVGLCLCGETLTVDGHNCKTAGVA